MAWTLNALADLGFIPKGILQGGQATGSPLYFGTLDGQEVIILTDGTPVFRLTADNALIMMGGHPAVPTEGTIGYDPLEHSFKITDALGTATVRRKYYLNTLNSNTVANTAAETNFTTAWTIPANTLSGGKTLHLDVFGYYNTDAVSAGTATLKIKVGNTTLLTTGAITLATGLANRQFALDAIIGVRATGTVTKGKAIASGWGHVNGAMVGLTNAGVPVFFDTTVSQTLQVSVTMSVADADNNFTVELFEVT